MDASQADKLLALLQQVINELRGIQSELRSIAGRIR